MVGLVAGVVLIGCSSEDPVAEAAVAICEAIHAEPSDMAAFENFERDVARERREGLDEQELLAALDEQCGRAIAAISVTAVEEEPEEPEPEPDPEPEPVDLVTVDWPSQSWSTDCTPDDTVQQLQLSESPWDEPGFYIHDPTPDSGMASAMTYAVDISEVVFGDLTGDGHDEAVFPSECFLGNDYLHSVEVWSQTDDGELLQLPTVITYSKWDGTIDHVEVIDQGLLVTTSEGAPGDDTPHLNGYPVEVVTDWSFDGSEWLSDEISRSDPPEAESSGPASCSNPGASPEDATKCLIDALSQGDREAANKAATDIIVEFFFEDGLAASPPSPGATFQGCGEPRLGMRVAGGVACFWEAPGSGEFVQFDVAQQDGVYRVAGAGYGSAWPG